MVPQLKKKSGLFFIFVYFVLLFQVSNLKLELQQALSVYYNKRSFELKIKTATTFEVLRKKKHRSKIEQHISPNKLERMTTKRKKRERGSWGDGLVTAVAMVSTAVVGEDKHNLI